MPNLILIKHSQPEIDPSLPACQWHLSAAGRARCDSLAEHVARHAPDLIVSSTEPKAMETGQIVSARLGLPLLSAEGLREHDRRRVAWMGPAQWQAQMAQVFARPGELVLGQETADEAHGRFVRAVQQVVEEHPGRNPAIVAHGTVIALLVSRRTGCEPFPFWQRLGLPSLVVLSLPDLELVTVIETVT